MDFVVRIIRDRDYRFKVFMILVAVHSSVVGISQIILPLSVINGFGFGTSDHFFISQGGVFHIAVSAAYLIAALRPVKYRIMIFLSIIIKATASVFILSYYIIESRLWVILLSGIVDFAILIIMIHYYRVLPVEAEQDQ